jgi:membrane protein
MRFSSQPFGGRAHLGGSEIRELVVRAWHRIDEHAILTRAAAITFYAIAALVPFMALVIALTAQWLPAIERPSISGNVAAAIDPLGDLLPSDAASVVRRELDRLGQEPPTGLISTGVVALLWLSSSVFVEIIDAMNVILGVKETRPFWKRRLLAVTMTLGEAAILIAATVTIVAWPQILSWLNMGRPLAVAATAAHAITVSVMVFLGFALALRVGPDAQQEWRWTIPGSLFGTIILLGVSVLFRFYVQNLANYSATYGSLAGMIALMCWIWLGAVDLLVAAELNEMIRESSAGGGDDAQEHTAARGSTAARAEVATFSRALPELVHPSDGDRRVSPETSRPFRHGSARFDLLWHLVCSYESPRESKWPDRLIRPV